MKRKFLRAVALGMALTLTFSMTALAAPSPTTDQTEKESISELQAELTTIESGELTVQVNGKNVTAKIEAEALGDQEIKVVDQKVEKDVTGKTFTSDGKELQVAQNAQVVKIDVVLKDENGNEIQNADPSKSYNVPIKIDGVTIGKQGVAFLVLHEKKDGTWEQQIVTADANGVLHVNLTGLSPVVVVELTENVKAGSEANHDEEDEDEEEQTTVAAASSQTAKSASRAPKTGEALPVAGVTLVVALAGLAVGAKKVKVH